MNILQIVVIQPRKHFSLIITTSGSSASEGLSTTAVLAIVVPVAAVLSVGLGMLFIHQQRRQAVQALIKAEEGERRNYKIDLLALSIDWLIGSGSFGHVYRGEYRGADVAIKKLKKQNMGNQQLEDFAKEAMVMVGLRHPSILYVCVKQNTIDYRRYRVVHGCMSRAPRFVHCYRIHAKGQFI